MVTIPSAFQYARHFLLSLRLFCLLPIIPSPNLPPLLQQEKHADGKKKYFLNLIITINLCLNNFERSTISRWPIRRRLEEEIYMIKYEQNALSCVMSHSFSNFLEYQNLEFNLIP